MWARIFQWVLLARLGRGLPASGAPAGRDHLLGKTAWLEPDDVVVKLSLAELLLEARPGDKNVCGRVVKPGLWAGERDTVPHCSTVYKARALRGPGLLDAARETFTGGALRRKKGRSEDLLRSLRYERALVYEDLGQRRARAELEKLYAEVPDYEDVAARLGL